ncbi:MAG: Biopolymer transport protein ExbD/TolR [Verrucomicrobia bacterium]|nr:Biopolymer transport protein ExbD/TolR [Verrucomicrobiota bacterium]
MARTFRRRHSQHPISELNVTNLIDLGFTLLIIFMITSQVIKEEQTIPVNLPNESKSAQSKPDKDARFVSVSIDARGNFYVENRAVSFNELKTTLRGFAVEPKVPIIRVRGDAKLPYEKIVQLMDELKKNNLLKFTLDTQSPN